MAKKPNGFASRNGHSSSQEAPGAIASAYEKAGGGAARSAVDERRAVIGNCLVCKKPVVGGWYGRYGDEGVCSKACNNIQDAKPRYPSKGNPVSQQAAA